MNDLPLELYGLPFGALIMVAVGGLERAGLPSRFAGLAAILIATLLGAGLLTESGQPAPAALVKGASWGLAIVAAHKTTWEPIRGMVGTTTHPPASSL